MANTPTKKDLWKTPDYQALIDSGVPYDVVYFIKQVHNSLEPKPIYLYSDDTTEKRLARDKQYIETVKEIQSFAEKLKTQEDAISAFDTFMIGNGYYERMTPGTSGYYAAELPKLRDNPTISRKLAITMFFKSEYHFNSKVTEKANKAKFGIPKSGEKSSVINNLSKAREKTDKSRLIGRINNKTNVEL